MARLTATEYRKQLLAQGQSPAEADAQVAAVMRHRYNEDLSSNPNKADLEIQKAYNYAGRANNEQSGSSSSGGSSGSSAP